jgi:hypothetical protein
MMAMGRKGYDLEEAPRESLLAAQTVRKTHFFCALCGERGQI